MIKNKLSFRSSYSLLLGPILLAGFSVSPAKAATQYWDVSSSAGITTGPGNWSTSTSDLYWATSGSPGAAVPTYWTDGNDAVFQAGAPVNTTSVVTVNGTVTVNSISTLNSSTNGASATINSGTSALLILGTTGISAVGNGLLTLNTNVQMTGSQTWDTGSSGTGVTVQGVLSDGGSGYGLTKTGRNQILFNGGTASSYTGPTIVNGGTFIVDFSGMATPTNLLSSSSALTLSGSAFTVRGKTASTASQTLGNLTLTANGGQSSINIVQVGTSTGLTLGNTWTRSAGSTLNFNPGGSTNTPLNSGVALTNGIIGGYATISGTGFATITAGKVAAATTTALTSAANDGTVNYSLTSSLAHNSGNWSANSLVLNGGGLDIGGGTLTLTSGGVLDGLSTAGADVISNGQLGATGSEVIIQEFSGASRSLEVSATISGGSGRLTKGGLGKLIITGANTYTGDTVVGAGTLQIGNGGTTGSIASSGNVIVKAGTSLAGGAVLAYNRTDASSVNNVTGGGNILVNSGTLTLQQNATGLALGQIGGASGATIEFAGTGDTSLGYGGSTGANYLNTPGLLYKFTSGTVNFLDSARGSMSNIEIAGGTVNIVANPLSMSGVANGTQTFTISSGVLNANFNNGLSGFNSTGGAGSTGLTNSTFVATQTGGTINVANLIGRFDIGNSSGAVGNVNTTTYNMSGGLINQTLAGSGYGMKIGADTTGFSTATFNFSGGKIIENLSISGAQGAGAKQAFVWTGGTLATFAYDATNLTSTSGLAVSTGVTNTLTNGGGILAPGDIGTVGKTLITGRYNVSSANAALAIDIGGTTASAAFQETAGSGKFDNIQTNGGQGTVSLGGKLNVALVDGFTPTNANTFKIINTIPAGVSGTFNNTAAANGGGVRVALADGLSSFKVTYNTADVTLGSYLTDNQWSAVSGSNWSAGNSWSAFTPSLTGHIAKFADGPAAGAVAVNLDANETLAGLQFNSTTRSYTISSGSSNGLTLDNGGSASNITATGTHIVNVPLALNNNVAVDSSSGSSLALNGNISGTGRSLTKSGLGSLALGGSNSYSGATTVNAGTLLVNGSLSNSAVTVNGGGTLGGSGSISGAVTVNSGGILSAGNSPGVLAMGSLDLNNGSGSVFEINGTTRGTQYDGIDIASGGAIDFDGTLNLAFGNVSAFSGSDVLDLFSFDTTSLGDFDFVLSTGFYAGSWNKTGDIWELVSGGQTLSFNEQNGDLSFTSVPEPSTYALVGMGLSALWFLRRRQKA